MLKQLVTVLLIQIFFMLAISKKTSYRGSKSSSSSFANDNVGNVGGSSRHRYRRMVASQSAFSMQYNKNSNTMKPQIKVKNSQFGTFYQHVLDNQTNIKVVGGTISFFIIFLFLFKCYASYRSASISSSQLFAMKKIKRKLKQQEQQSYQSLKYIHDHGVHKDRARGKIYQINL